MNQNKTKKQGLCSIVIPVYKSTESLREISSRVNILRENTMCDFEIIFVNDSPQYLPTKEVLHELSGQYPFVHSVCLRKNQGQHIAIVVGMSFSQGEYIITMDDDLQHPVSEIPKLIEVMQRDQSLDAAFAIPVFNDRKHKKWRNLGSYMLSKVDDMFLAKPKGLIKSSFRIMKHEIAMCVVKNFNAMPSISSLIIHYTHNIINVHTEHHERRYGKSHYSIRKLISLTLNNIINYSSYPLKSVGFVGLISFLLAIGFVIYTVSRKLFLGIEYPGYTTIVTLTGILGGLNLLSVGIIGEYLIRILRDIQKPKIEDLISSRDN